MDHIELHPYDSTWQQYFGAERDRIREIADEGLRGIYHIGSTSVPGFLAKPSIDILAVYASSSAIHRAKKSLIDDYRVHRDEEDRVVLIWNKNDTDHSLTLHLRPQEAQGWRDQLVFRNLLRDDPIARAKYEGAKRTAASEYPSDGKAYTAAKEPIIRLLTAQAYDEGYDEQLPDFPALE